MLDQENCDVEGVTDPADLVHQLCSFAGVHTGSGLVQQDDGGIGSQSTDDLQTALNTVGQAAGLGIGQISQRSWIFLILSGLATGASWLCYYKALQMGQVSKVAPIDKLSVVITLILAFIFLHEQFTTKSIIGCILIGAGTLLMVL